MYIYNVYIDTNKVLKDNDFNKEYFTEIDIRKDKVIKLYSKRAELLTTHPEGSYKLEKDDKGQYYLYLNFLKFYYS